MCIINSVLNVVSVLDKPSRKELLTIVAWGLASMGPGILGSGSSM